MRRTNFPAGIACTSTGPGAYFAAFEISGATFEARKATFAKFQDRVYDQVLFLKFGDLTRKQAARANVQGFAPYRIPRMWNVWFEG